jgi:hypothetical protein
MEVPVVGPLIGRAARAVARAFDPSKIDLAALHRERARVLARVDALLPQITRALPVARAIPLGGSPRVASELQLKDLAELQAWLEEREPHPMDGMPPAWADPEPETRPGRLAAAWERAATWPARLGTDRAAGLLEVPEGRCFFLLLVLRKADPGFGLAEAAGLLPRITPAEWSGLARVAWAINPREEIAGELAPDRSPAGGSNWCLSLHRATQAGGGMTYRELGGLYLSQWRNLCNEGKPHEFSAESSAASERVRKALENVPAIHVQVDL